MSEESRAAQSAAGPEIDRLRQREAELLREVRRHNNEQSKFDALLLRNSDRTWSPTNPGHQKASKAFTSYAAKF